MAWDDDERFATRARGAEIAPHVVGASLDALSESDLAALVDALREEISRIEAALRAKQNSRTSAEAFFK